jgi:hypothetical protein
MVSRVRGGLCSTSYLKARKALGCALRDTEHPSTLALVGRASGLSIGEPGMLNVFINKCSIATRRRSD